jgi:hypothetical protein
MSASRTHGRHSSRITLHPRDARFLRLTDHLGRDALVKIQTHQELDVGLDSLESVAVGEALLDGRDGRDQVGLAIWSEIQVQIVYGITPRDMEIQGVSRRDDRGSQIFVYGIEHQAYHDINLIDTALPHRRRDQLRHLTISQMHMRVEGSG